MPGKKQPLSPSCNKFGKNARKKGRTLDFCPAMQYNKAEGGAMACRPPIVQRGDPPGLAGGEWNDDTAI